MLLKVKIMKRFKLILKSLINNDACVEGGRKHPFWIALIMFFLSMVLAVIPVFVQTITKKGSSFVSSNSYGVEVGTQRFVEDINEKGLIMEVKEQDGQKYLSLDQETWDNTYTYTDHKDYHVYQHYSELGQIDLEVYYIQNFTSIDIEEITKNKPVWSDGEFIGFEKRTVSFIIFGSKDVYSIVYNMSGAQVGSLVGDYKHCEVGFKLNDLDNVSIDGNVINVVNVNAQTYAAYVDGVWANWIKFFDDAYLYQRGQLTWKTTLLMFGINAGLVIFMGLMIFILTRGKHNPYRIFTIFECMWIACWASLTPAILTSGLGFLIKSFSQIIFPLLLGVRIMWLSMKSLRPDYGSAPQQNQSKQVKTVDVKPVKNKK